MLSKSHMQDFILDLLMYHLPVNYEFHNYKHTMYVQEKAVEIGKQENCNVEELELLSIAALWHDIGYINIYDNHEEESCRLAQKYLPKYGVNDNDISKICGMIRATKIPQLPQNNLEAILADADLEYLATDQAEKIAHELFLERAHLDSSLLNEDWNKVQIVFLKDHHYFTNFCIENKESAKAKYLAFLMATQ